MNGSIALAILIPLSLLALTSLPTARALDSCSSANSQSWNPAKSAVVTISVAACVVVASDGSTYGVHIITTSVSSSQFKPELTYGYFAGGPPSYSIGLANYYGVFPDNSLIVGPFPRSTPLTCAISNLTSFTVTYTPTKQSFTFLGLAAQAGSC